MKRFSIILTAAVLLAACGGGSGGSAAPASASTPPATQVATSASPTPAAVTIMPPVAANAVRIVTGGIQQGGNTAVWNISFTAAVNLTVSGELNQLWVSATAPGGSATVSGNQNTIVFLPGTVTTVNVTGSANVFYLVEGSPITIEGTGAGQSAVKYYKP